MVKISALPLGSPGADAFAAFVDGDDTVTSGEATGTTKKAAILPMVQRGAYVLSSTNTPPLFPEEGGAHIVTATASGAWAGQEDDIAIYLDGSWEFYTPTEGWQVWDQANNTSYRWTGSSWTQVADGSAAESTDLFYAQYQGTPTANVSGDGTEYTIPFDTEIDAATWASLNTSTGEVTISDAGLYLIKASARWSGGTTSDWGETRIYVNGTLRDLDGIDIVNNTGPFILPAMTALELEAGDVVKVVGAIGAGAKNYELNVFAGSGYYENSLRITKLLPTGSAAEVNAQIGTTYTLVIGDANDVVTMNNASANTLTIPANSAVAFPIGTVISVIQLGAGATTITGDTGVTVNGVSAGSATLTAQHSAVSLVKLDTNTWNLAGGHGGVS